MATFLLSAWIWLDRAIVIFVGFAFAGSCLVWGYSYRALKVVNYPSLDHFRRRQYAETWDTLASSPQQARRAVSGKSDEKNLGLSARRAVKNIIELGGIEAVDHVLEIGCGVARIGLELAPRCQQWTGADISKNMLAYAAERLSQFGNVRLVHLQAANLDAFPDNSFDFVYLTNMFDHLDQLDRYKYILDAFRVLRPSGRLYVDNTDLESDAGWVSFANGVATIHDFERPSFLPMPTTESELTTYAKRAGFSNIRAHHRSPLVILTATKLSSQPESTSNL